MSTTTDDRLSAEIASANQAASEAWARFETARNSVKDDPANRAAIDAAEAAGREYDGHRDRLTDLRRVRDITMRGDGPGEDGNGPTDGPAGFTVGDSLIDRIRREAGMLAARSPEYLELKRRGAFHVSERKSVEAVLIRRAYEESKGADDPGYNLSREALFEAIKRGDVGGDMSRLATLVTGTGSTSAGALVQRDFRADITPFRTRPLRLVDLITVGRTDSDEVAWPQWSAFTNAAAETAEATAATGTSGTKPESALDFIEQTTSVRTIAHWIPATKRALSDAGQLRTYIDQILRLGLDLRLDTQLAAGNGTGENLRGIYNTVGIGAVIRRAPGTTGNSLVGSALPENAMDVIHRAITTVRLAFFEPNAVGIHPQDFEAVRLTRGTAAVANTGTTAGTAGSGDYIMGDPLQGDGGVTLWGLRPVVSAAFTQGLPVVGDWTQMVLWLREGTQVLASDSHMDFFIRNMVAILAEFRAALGVLAPAAFCTAAL